MKLFLQIGHGMVAHAEHLLSDWPDSGAILSPRDNAVEQMQRVARQAEHLHEIMIDPQCYLHDADHHLLEEKRFDYWETFKRQTTPSLLTEAGAGALLDSLAALNQEVGTTSLIVPGLLGEITSDWDALHRVMLAAAAKVSDGRPLLATVTVRNDNLQNEDQVEEIIDYVSQWPTDGFYLIVQPQGGQYLVEDPVWMANVLILAAGLKLTAKRVIVGYANHQLLALAATNIDGIASGTFLNVRSFGVSKFYEPETTGGQRSVWYYCPHALSEYKTPYLDIGKRNGVLDSMKPQSPLADEYCALLFGQAAPSTVNWGETEAHRHYLSSLYAQCGLVAGASYPEALANCNRLLDNAESIIETLRRNGVTSQQRGFGRGALDATRSALVTLDKALRFRLKHEW